MKQAPNEKAPSGQAEGFGKDTTKRVRKFTAKSTATAAQRERIMEALRTGPRTSYDLRRMGCYQCAARVLELRRMGCDIRTERVTLYDLDGYAHPRAARYHLVSDLEADTNG